MPSPRFRTRRRSPAQQRRKARSLSPSDKLEVQKENLVNHSPTVISVASIPSGPPVDVDGSVGSVKSLPPSTSGPVLKLSNVVTSTERESDNYVETIHTDGNNLYWGERVGVDFREEWRTNISTVPSNGVQRAPATGEAPPHSFGITRGSNDRGEEWIERWTERSGVVKTEKMIKRDGELAVVERSQFNGDNLEVCTRYEDTNLTVSETFNVIDGKKVLVKRVNVRTEGQYRHEEVSHRIAAPEGERDDGLVAEKVTVKVTGPETWHEEYDRMIDESDVVVQCNGFKDGRNTRDEHWRETYTREGEVYSVSKTCNLADGECGISESMGSNGEHYLEHWFNRTITRDSIMTFEWPEAYAPQPNNVVSISSIDKKRDNNGSYWGDYDWKAVERDIEGSVVATVTRGGKWVQHESDESWVWVQRGDEMIKSGHNQYGDIAEDWKEVWVEGVLQEKHFQRTSKDMHETYSIINDNDNVSNQSSNQNDSNPGPLESDTIEALAKCLSNPDISNTANSDRDTPSQDDRVPLYSRPVITQSKKGQKTGVGADGVRYSEKWEDNNEIYHLEKQWEDVNGNKRWGEVTHVDRKSGEQTTKKWTEGDGTKHFEKYWIDHKTLNETVEKSGETWTDGRLANAWNDSYGSYNGEQWAYKTGVDEAGCWIEKWNERDGHKTAEKSGVSGNDQWKEAWSEDRDCTGRMISSWAHKEGRNTEGQWSEEWTEQITESGEVRTWAKKIAESGSKAWEEEWADEPDENGISKWCRKVARDGDDTWGRYWGDNSDGTKWGRAWFNGEVEEEW